jgi:hypothetical protein
MDVLNDSVNFFSRDINAMKVALTALAAWLTMWVLAFLWHAVFLSDFYVAHLFPGNHFGHVNVPLLAASYGMLGFAVAWLYSNLRRGTAWWMDGLRAGWAVGLISVVPMSLMIYAVGEVTLLGLFVDQCWHLLVEQPAGGLIVAYLRRTSGPLPRA